MNNMVKVARLHLVDRFGYTWLLWGVLAFTFIVNFAIFAVIPVTQPTGNYTGALVAIYIFMAIIGVQAATKFLPFAFTLGVSRRTYYLGTLALVIGLCAIYSGILTVLWWIEGLTNGWGLQLHFFRVPWILDGPWYQIWITNFALLAVVFLVGLWLGLIYRRFGLTGSVLAYAALSLIVVAAAMLITWRQAWPALGNFLVNLNVLAASGLVLLLGVVVAAGGYLTIRRITV
ncbi:MAG: ABC transporter permease [Nakamurella sp.]